MRAPFFSPLRFLTRVHFFVAGSLLQGARSVCVRGREYSAFRVDVKKAELRTGGAIARGGASTVYHGEWLGRRVAVKRPRLPTTADMDRFHAELQLLEALHGEAHIMPALVASAHPPEYSIVFPLMENGTLEDLLHKQRCAPTAGAKRPSAQYSQCAEFGP